jgi:hypothetical protein
LGETEKNDLKVNIISPSKEGVVWKHITPFLVLMQNAELWLKTFGFLPLNCILFFVLTKISSIGKGGK